MWKLNFNLWGLTFSQGYGTVIIDAILKKTLRYLDISVFWKSNIKKLGVKHLVWDSRWHKNNTKKGHKLCHGFRIIFHLKFLFTGITFLYEVAEHLVRWK